MFWWDIDVALLVLFRAALAGMVAGFFGERLRRRPAARLGLRSRGRRASTPPSRCTCSYWHLPAFMTGLKRTPPSYLRELAG
jgi:conjugal transfer pilus assembly protein TraL